MTRVKAPNLQNLQRNARSYPAYLLPYGGSALALFSAGFLGVNDCIHFLRKGMSCSCVDTDKEKLAEMARLYPSDWFFHQQDAWSFATEAAKQSREWDVVCVDTFLGKATAKSVETIGLWTLLARELVTMTIPLGEPAEPPKGWKASEFPRSPRASWLVLERA